MSQTPPELLRLSAEDADDLRLISAQLQDAISPRGDLTWLPRRRCFVGVFNRFMWNGELGRDGAHWRCQSALEIHAVRAVRRQDLPDADPRAALSLLALDCSATGADAEDPAARITLHFAPAGAIRLDVECIEAYLRDYGTPWRARGRPAHPLD
ncbi:MAG: DUF2948 family protein [Alphaproteobacteria bacterium]|nr:DUF2948 family protein [Alphaproteobacteria bacterium]